MKSKLKVLLSIATLMVILLIGTMSFADPSDPYPKVITAPVQPVITELTEVVD